MRAVFRDPVFWHAQLAAIVAMALYGLIFVPLIRAVAFDGWAADAHWDERAWFTSVGITVAWIIRGPA